MSIKKKKSSGLMAGEESGDTIILSIKVEIYETLGEGTRKYPLLFKHLEK